MCPPNQFALVIYIPDPLGGFLDDLRLHLAPDCNPRAHVSVLPPRPLAVPWQKVAEELASSSAGLAPFEIEATGIRIFATTDVVYIDVGAGSEELHQLHAALNSGPLAYQEPFHYHPHITLAQEIPLDRVPEVYAAAKRAWRDYTGPRRFRAGKMMFVQNDSQGRWKDLAEVALGGVPVG